MKKITTSLVLVAMVLISIFTFTSCNETNYTLTNVKEKYLEIVSTYSDGVSNSMFNINNNAINIKFDSSYIKFNGTPSTNNEKRFYAFNYYDDIFAGLFSYYETYSDKFYSTKNEIPKEEINSLYNKVVSFEKSIKTFNNSKIAFEEELSLLKTAESYENIHYNTVKIFTYEYNRLVESSINFLERFMQIHKEYIFGEEEFDKSVIERTFEEAKFYISKFVFLENFKALNNIKGENGSCDLAPLVTEDLAKTNTYVLVDDLNFIGFEIKAQNDDIATDLKNLIYFRNCFVQDFKIYNNIYSKFDVYEFAQNKLNVNSSANLSAFVSGLNSQEESQYQFMENFRVNTYGTYIDALLNLIESND